jgi:DNA-binding transcriptional ArsR family regulator
MSDQIFKALSDANRRKILSLLREGDMTVSEILTHFDFTQASLSHHLDILKRAGLVLDERQGQFVRYSLNVSVFEEFLALMVGLFKNP